MVTAIFSAIAALPQLCAFVEKFALWITEQIQIAKDKKTLEDLAKATALAKEKKDTSGMDNIFDPSKKK